MNHPILCLDFDGVIHSYQSGWKGPRTIPDPPVPGAMAFLVAALGSFEVAIHSSRSRYWGGRRAMKTWLNVHMVNYFWEKYPPGCFTPGYFTATDMEDILRPEVASLVSRIAFPLWKPAAHVTIDDRALTFTGVWPDLATLREFKPWNRQ